MRNIIYHERIQHLITTQDVTTEKRLNKKCLKYESQLKHNSN